jgi:RimJ/RimL family protein N-acetyltransferase
MKQILQTERLYLRELELSDAPFIIQLVNSPGWLQYIGDRNIKDIKQAEDYLVNGPLKSYSELNYGLSLVALRNTHLSIGMCGLLKRNYLDHPDIGFAFLPDAMGKGYAFEITTALKQHAATQWGIEKILAIVQSDNDRSIQLLEKLGLNYQEIIIPPDTNQELLLFSN